MNRGEPVYFGTDPSFPGDRPLFGWVHRASSPARLGLLVCNAFGFEAVSAHRSMRRFAEEASAAGFPSLRFDYDGTGDSAGHDGDPARLAAWVASVHQAVVALRSLGGVERVAILGVRLGALLATLAATARDDIDGLVAIAPVVTGKTHLRELRALQMALGLREPPVGAVVDKDLQETVGFFINAETRAALEQVDLAKLDKPPAAAVLLLERDDLPGNDAWPNRLASQGVNVERRRLPGYVEMMLGPEPAQVPEAMVRATVDWLRARSAQYVPTKHGSGAARALRARVSSGVVESAELIGDAGRLFGVFSTPESPPPARRGLLLLNAGAVHRIGPSRLHVALARRWAALGHAVLRMDVAGIGDSLPLAAEPENVVYTASASDDVAQAVAFLRRQPGVTEVHALGLCSGGYNAFKAAVAGVPLDGVLLINPLVFFFEPNGPLDKAAHEVTFNSYARHALSLDVWKRLLRGEVDVAGKSKVMARRFAILGRGRARDLARRVGLPIAHDLALELETVARKNIALRFLFASGDPGIALLQTQGGAMVQKLQRSGQLSMEVINGPDHTFTPLWSQVALTAALGAHFDGRPSRESDHRDKR